MEIIYHTADIAKTRSSLNKLFNSGVSTIEIDVVMTKDGIPIWTHDTIPTLFLKSNSSKIEDPITLYDVLDINKHSCKLMLDFKYIQRDILNSKKFEALLSTLNAYDEMQIQSLDLAFINKLIYNNYSNIEVGLTVNILTRSFINKLKIPKLQNLDFMALSSELWEQRKGKFIDDCNSIYPDIKKYGWIWQWRTKKTDGIEDKDTIEAIINNAAAAGIITNNPELVKKRINSSR